MRCLSVAQPGDVRELLQFRSFTVQRPAWCAHRGNFCMSVHDSSLCLAFLQAEKLSSLGGVGKEKSAKTREEAEKLLSDTVKHCDDILAGAQGALEGMRSRCGRMQRGVQGAG